METIQNFAEITKKDFPLLNKNLKSNEQIIYLDHAATTQKPVQVLKKIDEYYKNFNANVHRGAHQLSAKATEEFENARYLISQYIKANSTKEIIFTRNATEAINLVARSYQTPNTFISASKRAEISNKAMFSNITGGANCKNNKHAESVITGR